MKKKNLWEVKEVVAGMVPASFLKFINSESTEESLKSIFSQISFNDNV